MLSTLKVKLIAIAVVSGCLLSGCSAGSSTAHVGQPVARSQDNLEVAGPPTNGSPVQTAYAYFRADNAKNCNLEQSFYRHPDPHCRDEYPPPSAFSTTTNVKCADLPITAADDRGVYCTWYVPPNPIQQGGKFWTIAFSRGPHRTWLIYNIGEG